MYVCTVIVSDLKLDNVMISKEPRVVKIIDFGMLVQLPDEKSEYYGTPAGTIGYFAPESIPLSKKSVYSCKSDIWQAGVILYVLLCGELPFNISSHAIRRGAYAMEGGQWDKRSEEAKDLVRHMLCLNPSSRYSCEDILAHPWLQISIESDNSVLADDVADSINELDIQNDPSRFPSKQNVTGAATGGLRLRSVVKEAFDVDYYTRIKNLNMKKFLKKIFQDMQTHHMQLQPALPSMLPATEAPSRIISTRFRAETIALVMSGVLAPTHGASIATETVQTETDDAVNSFNITSAYTTADEIRNLIDVRSNTSSQEFQMRCKIFKNSLIQSLSRSYRYTSRINYSQYKDLIYNNHLPELDPLDVYENFDQDDFGRIMLKDVIFVLMALQSGNADINSKTKEEYPYLSPNKSGVERNRSDTVAEMLRVVQDDDDNDDPFLCFVSMDMNADGYISRAVLDSTIRKRLLQQSKHGTLEDNFNFENAYQELSVLFDTIDVDDPNCIEYDEFRIFYQTVMKASTIRTRKYSL